MAHDEFERLLTKENPTAEDAGRLLLMRVVEYKRLDDQDQPDAEGREEEVNAVVRRVLERGDDAAFLTLQRYREAYHHFLFWPDVAEGCFVKAMAALERATNLLLCVREAEKQRTADRAKPVVLTAAQFKSVQRKYKEICKGKLSLRTIFRDLLDYVVDRVDFPGASCVPVTLDKEKINSRPNGCYVSHVPVWNSLEQFEFCGVPRDPFSALLNNRLYYSDSCHDPSSFRFDLFHGLCAHFPEEVDALLKVMRDAGLENADSIFALDHKARRAANIPSVPVGQVLASPLAFLYQELDIMPRSVAIVMEPKGNDLTGRFRDMDGAYTPPAPFWLEDCLDTGLMNIRPSVWDNVGTASKYLDRFFRWHTMFKLYAELFNVPDLMRTIRKEDAGQKMVDHYNQLADDILDIGLEKLRANEIRAADYEDMLDVFRVFDSDMLKPTEEAVKKVREKMTIGGFMQNHLLLFEELGDVDA